MLGRTKLISSDLVNFPYQSYWSVVYRKYVCTTDFQFVYPTLMNVTIKYSRVPNTTVGNPYSFFGACPFYMALFGTSRLLNLKKSSFLHLYSELLAYWFFPCTTLQWKVFVSNHG